MDKLFANHLPLLTLIYVVFVYWRLSSCDAHESEFSVFLILCALSFYDKVSFVNSMKLKGLPSLRKSLLHV